MGALSIVVKNDLEHLADAVYAGNEGVYFFFCVIKGEGSANCSADSEGIHARLRAMVTSTDCYAETVKERSHVEVMDVFCSLSERG